MPKGMGERIEKHLYAKGFRLPEIRAILKAQLLLCGTSALVGVSTVWLTLWPLSFAVGVILATFSFYSLARFIQQVILRTYTRQMLLGLLFRFYARLMLTGLILFGLIIKLRVPSSALVAGFATCMATMLVGILFRRAERKIKEA